MKPRLHLAWLGATGRKSVVPGRMGVRMRHVIALALLVVASFATHDGRAAPPAKAPPATTRPLQSAALLDLLRAPHPTGIDRRRLDRIGPDIPALLVEHATNARLDSQPRLRALGWLQYYATPRTHAVLHEVMNARAVDTPTVRIAVRAFAIAFPTGALDTVRPFLQHRDPYVREAAAFALGDLDDARARAVLEDFLPRETELFVRDAGMVSLRRIGERAAPRAE
ncbi:MAG: HEAT repeat domain-containing protein [Myxococcales bacterium]|nr:HEAT repeat domain-containing protein [Myxococcales bacterium]